MSILRTIIIIAQLGNIWARRRRHRRIFQSVSVVGYTLLMAQISNSKNGQKKQLFIVQDGRALVNVGKRKKNWMDYTPYNFSVPDFKKMNR